MSKEWRTLLQDQQLINNVAAQYFRAEGEISKEEFCAFMKRLTGFKSLLEENSIEPSHFRSEIS